MTGQDIVRLIFLRKKYEAGKIMADYIQYLKVTIGYEIKFIINDNAGEISISEQLNEAAGWGITFEFIATHTPYQNGRVEQEFETLYGRVWIILNADCLSKTLSYGFWDECAITATLLNSLYCDNMKNNPHNTLFNKR